MLISAPATPHVRFSLTKVLYELLGATFVERHFPDSVDDPLVLEEPYMDKATRQELVGLQLNDETL